MSQKHKIPVAYAGPAGAAGHLQCGPLPALASHFCVITQHGCSGSMGCSSVRRFRTERARSRRFCKIHRSFLRYSLCITYTCLTFSANSNPLVPLCHHCLLSLSSQEHISFRRLGTLLYLPLLPPYLVEWLAFLDAH